MKKMVATRLLGVVTGFFSITNCSAIYARSPMEGPPAYCTVFNHMVKSGGTTIKEMLEEASSTEDQLEPGLCTFGDVTSRSEACYVALHHSSVITGYGELLRNLFERNGRDCSFFTMVRHPINRLVSAFFYCPEDHDIQGRPLKWCGTSPHPDPVRDRLMDFAWRSGWGSITYRQMMHSIYCPPRFELCDDEHKIPRPPNGVETTLGREVMVKIKDILVTYTAVGITEEWRLSMELFNATLKTPLREWRPDVALNPGPQSAERNDILEWAHASPDIHRAVNTDMIIYDFAMEIFRNQTHEFLGTDWSNIDDGK